MRRLRLGTFNLLSGRRLTDGNADPRELADTVASLDVEVLAVQEVDQHLPRTGGVDQAGIVATALGTTTYRYVPLVSGTPGARGWRAAIAPGAHPDPGPSTPGPTDPGPTDPGARMSYGIGLVSRRPVRRWEVLGMRRAPGRYPLLVAAPAARLLWLPDEPRAAVAAVLEDPPLTVAGTHLSFVPGRNAVHLRQVIRWLTELPGPHILLGDLNLPGDLPARLSGWQPLVAAATYPAPSPRVQLDHVLAHGLPPGARADGGRAVRMPISDHLAVTVDLQLP